MLSLAKFIKKEIELRENLVGTGFLDPPPIKKTSQDALDDATINKALAAQFMTDEAPTQQADTRFTCIGEIVQTSGFQAEKTYIFYDTFVPEGWTYEDANEYENYGSQRDEYAEFNKRKSCTHLSKATVKLIDDDSQLEGTEYVSHFSFPVDFQFLARQDKFNERPFLLLQVNSVDSWGRHRVEGYGFVRFPLDPGYHQIEVETWRPRGSLQSEIHSFFLGGSIRIMRLEELIRTKFIDEQGQSDIVNRFGLETENSGKIKVNLNICFQNAFNKKANRRKQGMQREALQLETKRQVMMYKLKVKDTLEAERKRRLVGQRDSRRNRTNRSQRSYSADGFNLESDSMELSADEDRFNRNLRNQEVELDGDPYGDQAQYNQQNFAFTRTAESMEAQKLQNSSSVSNSYLKMPLLTGNQSVQAAATYSTGQTAGKGALPESLAEKYHEQHYMLKARRKFSQNEERDRQQLSKERVNRKDQSYKRVQSDNLWNETDRLSPRFSKYANNSNVFKKKPVDLSKYDIEEKEANFQRKLKNLLRSKQESHERHSARRLERFIVQFKSNQELTEEQKSQIQQIEQEDPTLFEELLLKRKWSYVSKDPYNSQKPPTQLSNAQWSQLNSLPSKGVERIVTDKILQYDKASCETILSQILDDKKREDLKKEIQKQDRADLRAKLKKRHDDTIDLEEKCGIRFQTTPSFFEASDEKIMGGQESIDLSIDPALEDVSKTKFSVDISAIESNTGKASSRRNNSSMIQAHSQSIQSQKERPMDAADSQTKSRLSQQQKEILPDDITGSLRLKFNYKKQYGSNHHQDILAMPKPEYQGRDFFQRSEFRGLLLADYQEAIGEKAFACVDALNTNTVSQFSTLKSFREALNRKKYVEKFYKGSGPGSLISKSVSRTEKSSIYDGVPGSNRSIRDKNVTAPGMKTYSNFNMSKLSDKTQFELQSQNVILNSLNEDLMAHNKQQYNTCRDNFNKEFDHYRTINPIKSNAAHTAGSQLRPKDKIFLHEPTDLGVVAAQQPSIFSRYNMSTEPERKQLMNQTGEFFTSKPLNLADLTDDEVQTQTVHDQIKSFDMKFHKNGKRSFKYPNIELNRMKDPHNVRLVGKLRNHTTTNNSVVSPVSTSLATNEVSPARTAAQNV